MRITFILTKECQLRCPYCLVEKSAEWMREPVITKAIDMCVNRKNPDVTIHFFGGEPLLDPEYVRSVTKRISKTALERNKTTSFFLSTNCINIDDDVIEMIKEYRFSLKLSIDGKPGSDGCEDSKTGGAFFDRVVAGAVKVMEATDDYYVNTVVFPGTAGHLRDNIDFLTGLGARRIQIAPAVGLMWTRQSLETFSKQLMLIYEEFIATERFQLLNIGSDAKNFLFNREITVDCDGSVYAGNVFLFSPPETASKFRVGHVDDNEHAFYYTGKRPPFDFYVRNVFPPDVMLSNMSFVRILNSFNRYVMNNSASHGRNNP